MTSSPDVTGFVDLTVYDATAQSLYDAAVTAATAKIPELALREGNTEAVLLEALALETSELVYAVNRMPAAITEVLLRLFGLERDDGTTATTTITFTAADNLGHTIPAGTRLLLDLGLGAEPIELATLADLTIAPGSTTGTAAAAAVGAPSARANGVTAGTALAVIDSVPYIDSAVLATAVAGGTDPETPAEFLDRGTVRLTRLTTTLVRADQFTAAALEEPYVARATTVDLFTPAGIATPAAPGATPSITGGTLTAAASPYGYRVAAINAQGETLASSTTQATIASGTTGSVALTWTAPAVPAGVGPITGYRVYRGGFRRANLGNVLTWTDAGALVGGAANENNASVNGTGPAPGTAPGYVTVYAAGPGGAPLSADDKATLLTKLTAAGLASLTITVADPTLNVVSVTAAVTVLPGYDPATVAAAVTAALDAYLSPETWPWAATVYRNELVALIDNVEGVATVTSLTAPAADVPLTGAGPLADAGTLTITAT